MFLVLFLIVGIPLPSLAQAIQSEICVPQFVDGVIDSFQWRTTLTLRNQDQTQSQVQIRIRDMDGDPLGLRIRRRTMQQVEAHDVMGGLFSPDPIRARATVAYRSEGDAPLGVGYAVVQSQERVQARVMLQLHDGEGRLWAETTYVPQPLFRNGTLHVDHTENGSIGLAFANPSDTTPATITLELYSEDGVLLGTTDVVLGPESHIARFVHEWLAGLLVDDAGYLSISSTSPVCGIGLMFREMTMTEAPLFVDQD